MLKTSNISPKRILKDVFGFDEYRPSQQKIIESVIRGDDNFVLMPTGGGKSLCFQIPALVMEGTAIIVSPLISLMQDQVQALQANGVEAYYLNSSLSASESYDIFKKLMRGEIKLLYVAPEKLLSESFLRYLDDIEISLFAIDEVHCVSQWGPDFRPEYQQLIQLRDLFPDIPMIALTATADKVTREDIILQLRLQNAMVHVSSFNRENLQYTVLEKHNPMVQVQTFLKAHKGESGIIYCLTRKKVDEVTEKLCQAGYNAAGYHAGMDSSKRQQTQQSFQQDNIDIVVATVAFGMGIDKSNVRFVIHYDIPKSIENYYQETGRAGRDGLPAELLLLYGLQGVVQAKALIENTQDETLKRIEQHKLNAMSQFAEAQICRRKVLLNYFNEELKDDCNNCDVCLNPPECYDATVDAQKVLSCIYRLDQRFGAGHVIEVLRGSENKKILQWGHHKLSTYAIGKDHSQKAWFSIIRQLIHHGYIEQDIANYSVLKLTEKSRPLLRSKEKLILAKPKLVEKSKLPSTGKSSREQLLSHKDYDGELFEQLRQLRKKLSSQNNVAPFIIFSDVALIDMATKQPKSSAEFLMINGVGQKKLESYGDAFMQVIKEYG